VTVKSQSAQDVLDSYLRREFLLIAGKDSVGKTCDLVALAKFVQESKPSATFNIIDTENKFKEAFTSFGSDAPNNIQYFKCENMNDVTEVTSRIVAEHKIGDWLAVESLSRIWEHAQNLGYEEIVGVSKPEYLERKRLDKSIKSPIPRPEDFWSVVKGAHDSAFLQLLSQIDTLNAVCTTTVARVKDVPGRAPNKDRQALRAELGIDSNLEGAPRLPYYVKTLVLQEIAGGAVSCRVLRDNLSTETETRPTFEVPDKKAFGAMFYATCRQGEIKL